MAHEHLQLGSQLHVPGQPHEIEPVLTVASH